VLKALWDRPRNDSPGDGLGPKDGTIPTDASGVVPFGLDLVPEGSILGFRRGVIKIEQIQSPNAYRK
jgi:hypothetical protein